MKQFYARPPCKYNKNATGKELNSLIIILCSKEIRQMSHSKPKKKMEAGIIRYTKISNTSVYNLCKK